jgi:hypothetical protein
MAHPRKATLRIDFNDSRKPIGVSVLEGGQELASVSIEEVKRVATDIFARENEADAERRWSHSR